MITINANAKINLTLDILGKRDDGYHEVSMIMQSINLFDTLTLKKLNTKDIILHGDVRGVENVQDNLIYKAVKLFLDTYKIQNGVEIELIKRIPIAAGLLENFGVVLNPMLASICMTISSLTVVLNSLRLRWIVKS